MSYIKKSKSDVHLTPNRVFEIIKSEYGILKEQLFDPCPLNPKFDGLKIDWKEYNFVNPPYSKIKGEKKSLLTQFVNKAIAETDKGNTTVMLLPSKTDQQWFHDLEPFHYNIIWIRKRLIFAGEKNNSPQAHFLICLRFRTDRSFQ